MAEAYAKMISAQELELMEKQKREREEQTKKDDMTFRILSLFPDIDY
jgi:predicted outer membrane lipoprotein